MWSIGEVEENNSVLRNCYQQEKISLQRLRHTKEEEKQLFPLLVRVCVCGLSSCISAILRRMYTKTRVVFIPSQQSASSRQKQGLTHHKFLEKSPTNTRAENTTNELTFLKRTVSRV